MTIWLIRHAQSLFNAQGLMVHDVALSPDGHQQAQKVNGHVDLVIISPLRRTHQTLSSSQITYDRLIVSDLCREFRNGSITDILEGETQLIETLEDAQSRIEQFKTFLQECAKKYKHICVISHHGFLCVLTGRENIANCEVILVENT
jgi:broad specificity phosphatase PhoE